jgi:hypothetical protein
MAIRHGKLQCSEADQYQCYLRHLKDLTHKLYYVGEDKVLELP